MRTRRNVFKSRHKMAACVIASFVASSIVTAVEPMQVEPLKEDAQTRKLWDTALIGPIKGPTKRRRYRVATPRIPIAGVKADTVVGITVWKLRHLESVSKGERLVVHEGTQTIEWVPERVSANRKLKDGDRVRISIEAARIGYLYVIDREQYSDGKLGEPFLIFPTTRTRAGNNGVKPGRVIEIPAQEDTPPYFTLRPSRANQVGELLSMLVTTRPLKGVQIEAEPIKLSAEQVSLWQKTSGVHVGRLEMENGPGKEWTKGEKEAGADTTRSLNQDEPAPQTLYYNPVVESGRSVWVNVRLRYGRATTGSLPRRH